jgi:hypothetical protein
MSIVKLSLPFSPAAVEDLRQRLRAARWPDEIAGSDWEYGFSLQFLQELCEYWASQIRLEIAAETRRSNLRGIPSPKSKRVRRTRIPTTSLVTARSALSLGLVVGKPSVIKQTLEMQSEGTSATSDPLKKACLARRCLGELVIKGPARLTALAKPCLLLGRDSGFIGSRVEETEVRTNHKYRNSLRSL